MAFRRRIRKPIAKRRVYRKRTAVAYRTRRVYKTRRRQLPIERNAIMPDALWRNLSYSQQATYNSPQSLYFVKSWRVLSLYDPDTSVGGGQPLGFDLLCPTFYQRYMVNRFRISGWVSNQSGGAKPIVVAFMFTPTASPSITTVEELMAQPHTRYVTIPGPTAAPGTYPTRRVSTGWIRPSHLLGRRPDNDTDSSLYNNNPTQELYCHLYIGTLDGSLGASFINGFYSFKIIYGAKLYIPTPISA